MSLHLWVPSTTTKTHPRLSANLPLPKSYPLSSTDSSSVTCWCVSFPTVSWPRSEKCWSLHSWHLRRLFINRFARYSFISLITLIRCHLQRSRITLKAVIRCIQIILYYRITPNPFYLTNRLSPHSPTGQHILRSLSSPHNTVYISREFLCLRLQSVGDDYNFKLKPANPRLQPDSRVYILINESIKNTRKQNAPICICIYIYI